MPGTNVSLRGRRNQVNPAVIAICQHNLDYRIEAARLLKEIPSFRVHQD